MHKNQYTTLPPAWSTQKRLLIMLKLSVILIFFNLTIVYANSNAQLVTIKANNISLVKAMKSINKQTGVAYFLKGKDLANIRKNVTIINLPLTEAMDKLVKNIPVEWILENGTIIVKSVNEIGATSFSKPTISEKESLPDRVITGNITDQEGNPLEGVSVIVKGEQTGTTTDSKGHYSLAVNDQAKTLVFSMIGYGITEVEITGNVIDAKLRQQASDLNEVVVVGYGTQEKKYLTASVSTVSGEDLVKAPVSNISTALKGQLAGLVAIQNTGKPRFDESTLTIRGIGTYTGQTAPLIMVDGISRDTYNDIDPNEIETISILKDASATAIYGVRGANGVILITTKRGKVGTPSISLTGQTAISSFTNLKPFANSVEYATTMNELASQEYWIKHSTDPDIHNWDDFVKKRADNWLNDGSITYTQDDIKYFQNAHIPQLPDGSANPYYDPYFHPNTNWVKEIFKKYAPMSQVNANISGGTKSMRYFVSLGYLNQGGLFKTNYMTFPDEMQFSKDRYNIRGNFDFDVSKNFKISVNLGTQFIVVSGMDNDDYIWEKKILWSFPMSSPGMIDGKYVIPLSANGDDKYNPMYAMEAEDYWNITNNSILNSSVKAEYNLSSITQGLSAQVIGSYDSYFSSRSYGRFTPILWNMRPDPENPGGKPIFSQNNDETPPEIFPDFNLGKWRKIYFEASLRYDRTFGNHSISAMVLGSREKRHDPNLQFKLPHAYEGVTSRINYNYKGKYVLEYDMGYNGSENFPDGKRFGYFPSYSASWLVSNENFFPKGDVVNFLKLRASYGEVGNDNIGGARYLYLPDTWKNDGSYMFGDLNNQHTITGADEDVLGNHDVTWEVSKDMNLAIELHFFQSRLSVIYEYYKNNRSNILSYRGTVPDIVQANLPPYNLGRVRSWGHNVEFSYKDNFGKVGFYLHGNGAIQRNKILFRDEAIVPGLEYQAATGKPVDQQLLLKADGLYTSWSELYALDKNGNPDLSDPVLAMNSDGKPYQNKDGNQVYVKDLGFGGRPLQPGDIKLIDYNNDGVIDEKDRVRTGNTINPVYNFGVTVGFDYKGFGISALFAGVAGIARGGMSEYHFDKQQGIFAVDLTRYSEERYKNGEKISFPMPAYDKNASGFGVTNAGNTFFLINTSYVRLQNLMLSYVLKTSFLGNAGIKSAKVYVSGDNLYTWAPEKIWGDPENLGSIGYPLFKTYNVGLSLNF